MSHSFFSTFQTDKDWQDAGLSNVQFLSSAGNFSTVFVADIWQGKYVLKVSHSFDLAENISKHEAITGYVINQIDNDVKQHFVQTIGRIVSTGLPKEMQKDIEGYSDEMVFFIIVQEYVKSGQMLGDWLNAQEKKIDADVIRGIIFQLVFSLMTANAKFGFQHNDLKMDNVMVDDILITQDKRRYVFGGDLFEITLPKGTPIVKMIDYGGSILRLPDGELPVGTSDVATYPLPLDVTLAKDGIHKRANDSDMLAIFKIMTNLIGNNSWVMPDNETWTYGRTIEDDEGNLQERDLLDYPDDILEKEENVEAINAATGLKLDLLTYGFLMQHLFMRIALAMPREIPGFKSLSQDNLYDIVIPGLEGDGNYFEGISAEFEARVGKYGFMFLQRLFGATAKERREFGVSTSDYGLANALYHPYFALDLWTKSEINARHPGFNDAYKLPEPEAPLEFSKDKQQTNRVRDTVKQLEKTAPAVNLTTAPAKKKREVAQAKQAQEEVVKAADRLKAAKETLEKAKAMTSPPPVVDEAEKAVEKAEEELENDVEEAARELDEASVAVDQLTLAETIARLDACFDKFVKLKNKEDLDTVFQIDNGKESGCTQDVIYIVLYDPSDTEEAFDLAKDDVVTYFWPSNGLLQGKTSTELGPAVHVPGYFETRGKFTQWRLDRFRAMYIAFIGAMSKYLKNELKATEVKVIAGKVKTWSNIPNKKTWTAQFDEKAFNEQWGIGEAPAVMTPPLAKPKEKEEKVRTEDIQELDGYIKTYADIYGNTTNANSINKAGPFNALEANTTQKLYAIITDTDSYDNPEHFKLFKTLANMPDILTYDAALGKHQQLETYANTHGVWKGQWKIRKYALVYGKLAEITKAILGNTATEADVKGVVDSINGIMAIQDVKDFNAKYPANVPTKFADILETIEKNPRYFVDGKYDWSLIADEIFNPMKDSFADIRDPRVLFITRRLGLDKSCESFAHKLDNQTQYLHCLSNVGRILEYIESDEDIPRELLERAYAEWPFSVEVN